MKVLLIPSAVLVPKELQGIGKLPTVMYPIDGKPIIEYIVDLYKDVVDKIFIIVCEKKEVVINYSKNLKNVTIIELEETHDLGSTINEGITFILKTLNTNDISIFINFGDTIIGKNKLLQEADTVYYSKEQYNDKWTFFTLDEQNKIEKIIDKNDSETSNIIGMLFVGTFYIKQVRMLQKCIKESLYNDGDNTDSFYQALKKYNSRIPLSFIYADDWIDVGHFEGYVKAQLEVRPREFNEIKIDKYRGILKKTSRHKEKLVDEINWYLKLPNNIKYISPRIYNYSTEIISPYVDMEYYSYHTLHELYLYGDIEYAQWRNIFTRIKFILDDMAKYTIHNELSYNRESMYQMYITKTKNRLAQLKKQKEFAHFFLKDISINGKLYGNLSKLEKILDGLLEKKILNYKKDFCIIHGDLCFANIMIDTNMNFLRIIDPRGRFGNYDIYGDQRYEYAKLLHCVEGKYDYIVKSLFSININDTEINYNIFVNEKNAKIYNVFVECFKEELENIDEIRVIEALLFLSMIPLHKESLNHQYIMLAIGFELLNKCGLEWR